MRSITLLGIAASLVMTISGAFAYPTLAGYSGTGILPTAYTTPSGQWNLAADYYNSNNDTVSPSVEDSYPIRLLIGLGRNDFELGGGYTFTEIGDDSANTWNVNAKYRLPFRPLNVDWALGARYGSTSEEFFPGTNEVNTTNVYFVGSKIFPLTDDDSPVLLGSLGLNWTQRDSDLFDSVDGFRVFAGASITFYNGFSLAADIESKNDDLDSDVPFSIVARYPFTEEFAAQVGYTNIDITGITTGEPLNSSRSRFFAGINLILGKASRETMRY